MHKIERLLPHDRRERGTGSAWNEAAEQVNSANVMSLSLSARGWSQKSKSKEKKIAKKHDRVRVFLVRHEGGPVVFFEMVKGSSLFYGLEGNTQCLLGIKGIQ